MVVIINKANKIGPPKRAAKIAIRLINKNKARLKSIANLDLSLNLKSFLIV